MFARDRSTRFEFDAVQDFQVIVRCTYYTAIASDSFRSRRGSPCGSAGGVSGSRPLDEPRLAGRRGVLAARAPDSALAVHDFDLQIAQITIPNDRINSLQDPHDCVAARPSIYDNYMF